MTFKSATQPLCRYCGKPIKKHTQHFYVTEKLSMFARQWNERHHKSKVVEGVARNRGEAQRLTNKQVVSVRYGDYYGPNKKERRVCQFSTWDGESYVDQWFCNKTDCAVRYAYSLVKSADNKLEMSAYREAERSRADAL